ncbi:MAG: hypothetical protein KatS3mg017_0397 [Fimbriimonadales bacterium]|nr:MAG: hypothetical protein KatS3mg017_0397 [Fimbriimonadales bacterium]
MQEWVEHQLIPSFRDPEWAQLRRLSPTKLLDIARQPAVYGEEAYLAASVLFQDYPEAPETSELLWLLRKETGPSAWIESAHNPLFRPVLERIAFASTDATEAAIASAITALILGRADFTPHVSQLLRHLDSEDFYLRISAGAALATLGNREGETVLASELVQGERRSALYFIHAVYIHGSLSGRKYFPKVIENAFLNCMDQIISCIKSSVECISKQPLYSIRERFDIHFVCSLLENLLSKCLKKHVEQKAKHLLISLYESDRSRYLGLLVVLRAFLTNQPYRTPDGQLLHCGLTPHPSSRRLLPLVEEMIHKLEGA